MSRHFMDYVNLFVKILKFRNVNVTNEYIQLDMPGSFELIKNKLFLILMSNMFLKFLSNQHQRKLHVPACCTTRHFVPYMHIDERTAWFFSKLIKTWFFCKFVPQNRRDHITPVLKKLHWLPVKQRVTYKILLLTFRALNGLAPIYIVDMLHRHRPARALRSANNDDLQVPSTSSRYGDRAFAVSAPRLWNALPCELKITSLISFKRLLKTHLFRMAYEQ